MNPVDLTYPLVGLADAQPGRESWELFWDAEFFATCNRREVSDRKGMLIVDVSRAAAGGYHRCAIWA